MRAFAERGPLARRPGAANHPIPSGPPMKYVRHSFEEELLVNGEELDFRLGAEAPIPWAEFWLNPRKVRGSDFLMRWSQGRWSEAMLEAAVNRTLEFVAIPYGPSGVAPDTGVRDFELYFERLEHAGLGKLKRPDLLIIQKRHAEKVRQEIKAIGGDQELPFTREDNPHMRKILAKAVMAVECENSLWESRRMPDFLTPLRPQKRLGGQLGLRKAAVVPTIILKEEDRRPLRAWQNRHKIPIHLWHGFYDQAYGIAFKEIERLIRKGQVEPYRQTFQAPGGATTDKIIYKVLYHHGYLLAKGVKKPSLAADSITDKNGHILPYVRFEGGRFDLVDEAINLLRGMGLP